MCGQALRIDDVEVAREQQPVIQRHEVGARGGGEDRSQPAQLGAAFRAAMRRGIVAARVDAQTQGLARCAYLLRIRFAFGEAVGEGRCNSTLAERTEGDDVGVEEHVELDAADVGTVTDESDFDAGTSVDRDRRRDDELDGWNRRCRRRG